MKKQTRLTARRKAAPPEITEERYHSMLDGMMEGCQILDHDWRYLYVNAAAERHNRRSKEELLGKRYMDMWPGIESTQVFSAIQHCLEERRSCSFENEFTFPDGSVGWFELSLQPVPEGVFILSWDITARKQAENDLRASQERFKAIASSTPDHILVQDRELRYTFVVNPQLGLTEQDMLGKTDFDILAAADAEKMKQIKRQVLETGQAVHVEMPLVSPAGEQQFFSGSYVPKYAPDGQIDGLIGYFQNVTELKRTEAALRASEERYRLLVENAPIGIGMGSLDGRPLAANSALLRMLGYSEQEYFQRNLGEFYMDPADRSRLVERLQKQGRFLGEEFNLRRKDGTPVRVSMTAAMFSLESSPALLAILEDMRERAGFEEARNWLASFPELNPSPIAELDLSGAVQYLNPTARRLFPDLEKLGREHAWLGGLDPVLAGFRSGGPVTATRDVTVGERTYQQVIHWLAERERVRVYGFDVSERTRAEEDLRRSEARYRALFNNMTEGFAVHEILCDPAGQPVDYRFLDINPAFEQLTGLKRADVIGKTHSQVLPDDSPRWVEEYGAVALTGRPVQFENYSPALRRYYNVFAYRPAEGQFAVLFMDVTERKAIDEALRFNLAKYTVLFEAFPLGITVSDPAGKILETNQEAGKLLGISEQEHLHRSVNGSEWRIIRPDGSPMPPEEYASVRALKEKARIENQEMGILRPDGQVTWISVTAAPMPVPEYGVVVTYGDITARKRAEDESARRNAELAAVFSAQNDVVLVYDKDMSVRQANPSFRKQYGFDPVGMHVLEIIQRVECRWLDGRPLRLEEQPTPRALQGENVTGAVFAVKRADGSQAVVETSSGPMRIGEAIIGSVTVWHDITDRTNAEAALRQAQAELEQRVADRTRELNTINAQLQAEIAERQHLAQNLHDAVNQSLFSAGLIAEVLPRLWERDQPAARQSLEDLRRLTRGAQAELRGLLAELRPDELREAELPELLHQLASAFTGRTNLPVALRTEGQGSLPGDVQVAVYRLCQEGLMNVVKHAEASRVELELRQSAQELELRLCDDGRGFDTAQASRPGHFGLGMMRERAAAAGLDLQIVSRPGAGTELIVRWPAAGRKEEDPQ